MGIMKKIFTSVEANGIDILELNELEVEKILILIEKGHDIDVAVNVWDKNKEIPLSKFDTDAEIAKAFKDMSDLSIVLKDDDKALIAWKKGFVADDFTKEEFKGLPIEWIWSLLDVDSKSIFTREMPRK